MLSNKGAAARPWRKGALLGSSALLWLACAQAASAQAAGPAPAETTATNAAGSTIAEVVVTASRVSRAGYVAPTPTVVVGREQVEQRAATNVLEVLNEVPSFKADTGPQTNGVRSLTPGATDVDLRGLGSLRTLVLVDGKRFVPQVPIALDAYAVDLNQIPTILLDRTEVVTGGASAQWGSDAVAGVVNLILRKTFEGVEVEAQGGGSDYGDNRDVLVSGLAGTAFAGGKGHAELAVSYEKNDGVGDEFTRPFGRQGYSIVSNLPGATPTNLILPNVQFSTLTPGGVITSGPLKGTQFLPGGLSAPLAYGSYVGASNMVGGGNQGNNIDHGPSIEPAVQRTDIYGRGSYDFNDQLSGYVEASYAYTQGVGHSLPARDTTPDTICVGSPAAPCYGAVNPFIPAATLAAAQAAHATTLPLGRADYDFGLPHSDARNQTDRIVAGLQGSFSAAGDWKWDAAIEYGLNEYTDKIYLNRIHSNYNFAVNAVNNNGQIVCAATVPGSAAYNPAAAGCVPIDLFGAGAPSAAAIAYVTGTTSSATRYDQTDLTFNLKGEPFHNWAGPVSVAFGAESRFEDQKSTTDPISQAQQFESSNAYPLSGSFNVTEGYFETVVPLAHDMMLAQSLDLNGAVRVEHYSTSAGTQVTWKVGATYKPVDDFMFRVDRSRDLRAPNLYELDSGAIVTNQTIPTYGQPNVTVTTRGNSQLQPELADTLTLGGAYQPHFVRGLALSIDYFDINLLDAITALSAANTANNCLLGQSLFCNQITFVNGTPVAIATPYLNLSSVHTQGIDLSGDYRTPLSRFWSSARGSLSLRALGTYTLHSLVNTGVGATVDRAGEVGPNNSYSMPHFRGTFSAMYELDPASLTMQVRYIEGGKYDNTYGPANINNNNIPDVAYLDLFGRVKVAKQAEVFMSIDNLLNKAPPPDPNSLGYSTNPTYYDMIGRNYRVGVRLKF